MVPQAAAVSNLTDCNVRLAALAHGGECRFKLSLAVLHDLPVGAETSDDAAVYRIGDRQALVATTDFVMLCDPQTSGGLLVAVAPEAAATVLDRVGEAGLAAATVIGGMGAGPAVVSVD